MTQAFKPQGELLENLDDAGVLTLTLNRPGQRNALDASLIGAIDLTHRCMLPQTPVNELEDRCSHRPPV